LFANNKTSVLTFQSHAVSGRGAVRVSDDVVDAFVLDYETLSRSVIRDVLQRTAVRAKLAVASLDRIEKVANALKREFGEFTLDAIQLALQNNEFKLKSTVDELTSLRSVARLKQKYPRVAPDVLATVFNKCGRQYDAADRELQLLIAQLERSTLKNQTRASRAKSLAYDRPPVAVPPLQLDLLSASASASRRPPPPPATLKSPDAKSYGSLGRRPRDFYDDGDDTTTSTPSPKPTSFRDAILATHATSSSSAAVAPPIAPSPRQDATLSRSGRMSKPPAPAQQRGIFGDDDGLGQFDFDRDLGAIAAGFASTTSASARMQARALFDYAADRDDKLSFRKGQIIDLTEAGDTAWWRGTVDGSSVGKFPAAYVRPLNKDVRATALYAFHDHSRAEHLDFDAGDELVLLNKIPQSAWWEALHIKTGALGIAPVNYCQIMPESKETFDSLNV
jgi:hypothetical protein